MSDDEVKRGHWHASPKSRPTARLTYREPAPAADDRPPPSVTESGRYQALREHWLVAWVRRLLQRW